MGERVAIFIDGSNLYHALKNNFGRQDLHYGGFINKLCGSRQLFRAYYYNILQDAEKWPDTHREQQDFLDILNKTPYLEVKLGTTKVAQGVAVEKGIDIMLATDLLTFAWRDLYDTAIIVSGDADFTYALQAVKDLGKHVEVGYFENMVSRDLLDVADNRQALNHIFFTGLWAGQHRSKRKKITRRPPNIQSKKQPQPQSAPVNNQQGIYAAEHIDPYI